MLATAFTILAIVVFVIMVRTKNLLKDEVQQDSFNASAANQNIANPLKPYSLARVQTALWTIIISFSYLYVYFSKGNCSAIILSLNSTSLTLLGVSIGTTVVASAIDNSQQNNANRHQNSPTEGFLLDIMSDENGVSIHRFQAILFTVVAIVIYLNKLYCDNTQLPELDKTLLGIITLSYSGYLGIKVNENKST